MISFSFLRIFYLLAFRYISKTLTVAMGARRAKSDFVEFGGMERNEMT